MTDIIWFSIVSPVKGTLMKRQGSLIRKPSLGSDEVRVRLGENFL